MKEALVQKWNGMGKDDLCDEIENIYNTYLYFNIYYQSEGKRKSEREK